MGMQVRVKKPVYLSTGHDSQANNYGFLELFTRDVIKIVLFKDQDTGLWWDQSDGLMSVTSWGHGSASL